VRIRYTELPAGQHIKVTAGSRSGIVIHLHPGLTPEQRSAALIRARSAGRMGLGPRLPAARLTAALAADWLTTTRRTTLRILRKRPALVIPLTLIVAVGLVFLFGPAVHLTIRRHPGAGVQAGAVLTPLAPDISHSTVASPVRPAVTSPGLSPSPDATTPARRARPAPSATTSPNPPGHPSPTPTAPGPSPTTPGASPTSAPSPGPSPSPSPSRCVNLGPIGICL
jgi:hypothetical protein